MALESVREIISRWLHSSLLDVTVPGDTFSGVTEGFGGFGPPRVLMQEVCHASGEAVPREQGPFGPEVS